MKLLLTTLNSKFTHSSLALRYIKSYLKKFGHEVDMEEYTINNTIDFIQGQIYKGHYDVVTFSCYIWNFEMTLEIAKNLKKVSPNLTIIFGGPEVSFDPVEIMSKYDFIDYIVFGEGEESFKELYEEALLKKESKNRSEIKGIAYRENELIVKNDDRELIKNMDDIPFPYENLDGLENRILYYESTRGCPFNCQYCLSSTIKGVRFLTTKRTKEDLKFFIDNKVMQVKFVDRTFNANKKHALEIMKFCHENDNGYTNFHFEMTATLIDEETLAFMKTVRPGLFQLEVGVQSTNKNTISAIDRNIEFEKVKVVCDDIVSNKNTHLHLDLIAGLPYENLESFLMSIDDVIAIRPEKLQLGFLKLLKGSGLRNDMAKYGYIYNEKAPYEVMCNSYISYDEMLLLKDIEELMESYYNSGYFKFTIEYVFKMYKKPSLFFSSLAKYWDEEQINHVSHKSDALFTILYDFAKQSMMCDIDLLSDLLQFDYLRIGKRKELPWYNGLESKAIREKSHAFLQNEENLKVYLEDFLGSTAKSIIKKVHFASFNYDIKNLDYDDYKKEECIYLFNYNISNNIFDHSMYYNITEEFNYKGDV